MTPRRGVGRTVEAGMDTIRVSGPTGAEIAKREAQQLGYRRALARAACAAHGVETADEDPDQPGASAARRDWQDACEAMGVWSAS